jgi:hypothetical protein
VELLRLRGIRVTFLDGKIRSEDVDDPSPAIAACARGLSLADRLPELTTARQPSADDVQLETRDATVDVVLSMIQLVTRRTVLPDDNLPAGNYSFRLSAPLDEVLAELDNMLQQNGVLLVETVPGFVTAICSRP